MLKDYSISLWVNGNKNNETISFIIDHRGNYLFEIVLGIIDFTGWKKLSVSLPKGIPIQYFIHHRSKYSYLKIIGMKINPGDNKGIDISIDNLSIYLEDNMIHKNMDHNSVKVLYQLGKCIKPHLG